ncbi:MAG: NifU family protein [Gammaproteobacteria bacterium]
MPKIADIEKTPNPNAMRFVLKEPVTLGVARSFENAGQAANDPLASALFAIPHVTNVFYVDRWLTVTQDGEAYWDKLLMELAPPIRSAEAATPISMDTDGTTAHKTLVAPEDEDRLARITELLDERIRPALLSDGGGLEVMEFSGDKLVIRYQGACGTCPSSLSGTLMAIESVIRTIEPDIEVIAV